MHSTIFQIAEQPIGTDEYVGIDHVEAGEMTSIDYCREVSQSERAKLIKTLAHRILPAGMFSVNPDGETLTYKGGFTEWSKEYTASLHEKAEAIIETNVFKCAGSAYRLQKAIANPLDTDTLFITNYTEGMGVAERSRQLMRLIGSLQIGAKLYIGAILDYHF